MTTARRVSSLEMALHIRELNEEDTAPSHTSRRSRRKHRSESSQKDNWGNDSDSDGGSDYYKKTGVKEDARGTGADI